MRAIDLALKDLAEILRDRKSALFLVLMPLASTLFMGSVLSSAAPDPRLPVGWVNRDEGGALSASLELMLQGSRAIHLVHAEGPSAEGNRPDESVRSGAWAAAAVVPAGYSARAMAGEPLPLSLIAMPGSQEGRTAGIAVEAATKRLLGAVQAAKLSARTMEAQNPFPDDTVCRAFLDKAVGEALAAWERSPLAVTAEPAAGRAAGKAAAPTGFSQSSPGMIVQFAVFSLITSAMVLVLERRSNALRRLLTMPISRSEIIAGHALAMFLVGLLQQLLLVVSGQFLFHVGYLRQPLGTLLLVVTLALWVTSLGLLIGAVCRKEEQVVMASLIAMFIFAPLGGAWFPLEVAGKAFAAVGHLTPTAWAMDGLQNIVVRGLGLEATLVPAGILAAYALLFLVLALWRFRFDD